MRLHENSVGGLAFKPQVVDDTAVDGETIEAPWKIGRQIVFDVIAAAMASTDDITVTVEARRVGTTTWDEIKQRGSSTSLSFTSGDGETLENGHIRAALDLSRLREGADGNLPEVSGTQYSYDAIRLSIVNAVDQDVICGATYTIFDVLDAGAGGAETVKDAADLVEFWTEQTVDQS
jgi:hypothetical protein